ncbi:flagellar biosynthesis repressor FlbT [Flaviflagellibacter deserti]|uniref:Flagellar biosynthesis repressor FlbT n=1 Tax=Flaviflagellibacter deserti TaxID=2267266 RepID=A0ABV9YZA5_9HYPH
MALKVELKPGERIILGECVVTNDNQRTRLFIEGDAPILREKDIMTATTADSPSKRIYLAVQLMYLAKDASKFHKEYFALVGDFIKAAPSSLPLIEAVNNAILTNALYKALREAKALIAFEEELLKHAQRSTGVRSDSPEDGGPA